MIEPTEEQHEPSEDDEDVIFLCDLLPYVMEVFGRDGWDDPAMDIYNELDPRIDQ